MGFMKSLDISASALTVQRLRMDVISQNIANANTTRARDGKPYRRKLVVVQEQQTPMVFSRYLSESCRKFRGEGVKAVKIVEDPSPFKKVYDPGHPDADENGYVSMPNVEILKEMVDMISAIRSYEANVTAFNASKNMAIKALEIGG